MWMHPLDSKHWANLHQLFFFKRFFGCFLVLLPSFLNGLTLTANDMTTMICCSWLLDAQGCARCFQQRPFGSSLGERTALPGPLASGIVFFIFFWFFSYFQEVAFAFDLIWLIELFLYLNLKPPRRLHIFARYGYASPTHNRTELNRPLWKMIGCVGWFMKSNLTVSTFFGFEKAKPERIHHSKVLGYSLSNFRCGQSAVSLWNTEKARLASAAGGVENRLGAVLVKTWSLWQESRITWASFEEFSLATRSANWLTPLRCDRLGWC